MSLTVRQWRSDGLVGSGDGAGVESIGSTNHEISTVVIFFISYLRHAFAYVE